MLHSLEVHRKMPHLFLQFLALILFQLANPNHFDDPDRYGTHLIRGDAYYRAFDNARALGEYHKAYSLAPDSLSTLERMARTYNDMGRLTLGVDSSSATYYRKAVEYAEIMTRLYPNRAESHFWLALGRGSLIPFVGVGEKIRIGREVQDQARKTIELDSTFSHAYVILGIFQREGAKLSWIERTIVRVVFGQPISGSLEESERLLRVALSYDKQNSYAMFELYLTYSSMGNSEKAFASLRSLCEIVPTNAREQQQLNEATALLKTSKRQ
jgi:tetratricopeptide (TPR) repeat protein